MAKREGEFGQFPIWQLVEASISTETFGEYYFSSNGAYPRPMSLQGYQVIFIVRQFVTYNGGSIRALTMTKPVLPIARARSL